MIVDATHDEGALIALGAKMLREIRDQSGKLTGYDAEPDIDLSGYDAALASVKAKKIGPHWATLRGQRSQLLAASDWTQMADAPLTDAQKAAWKSYRQALRDLPQNTTDPASVTWPSAPSA